MIRLTLFNGSPLLVGKTLLENSVITVTEDGKYSSIILRSDVATVLNSDGSPDDNQPRVSTKSEHHVKETIDQIYEMLK